MFKKRKEKKAAEAAAKRAAEEQAALPGRMLEDYSGPPFVYVRPTRIPRSHD
eukprot:COSAG01_NODE_2163_length_8260_cov_7.415268_6_plen_52_part_00